MFNFDAILVCAARGATKRRLRKSHATAIQVKGELAPVAAMIRNVPRPPS
jgi:hypothetical protein